LGGARGEAEAVAEVLATVTLVVRDYDEAIRYFTGALGFVLLEDAPRPDGKRWIRVAPDGSPSLSLLLAKAADPDQERSVGKQTGGRVGFFLETSDFEGTYERMRRHDVQFLEEPRVEPYGTVAVFADLYGNRWDLIEPSHHQAGALKQVDGQRKHEAGDA
jgi:catechol 2,3-dioxygenase-like lactoylglutathione lyase family enzyme